MHDGSQREVQVLASCMYIAVLNNLARNGETFSQSTRSTDGETVTNSVIVMCLEQVADIETTAMTVLYFCTGLKN